LNFRDIFERYSVIKFHKNPPSGSLDGRMEKAKLMVAFRSFANVPKTQMFNNRVIYHFSYHVLTQKL